MAEVKNEHDSINVKGQKDRNMKTSSYEFINGRFFIFIIVTLLSLIRFTDGSYAKELAEQELQETFEAIIQSIFTGKEISPAFAKKEQALKERIQAGKIPPKVMENMLEETFPSLLNGHHTSRYILQRIAEPFNTHFGSTIPPEKIMEIMWRSAFSDIKEGTSMEIKVGTLAPPGTPYLNVPETILIPRLKRLSNGKLLIKIYGSGTMGEDTDILRKMDIGQLDVCGCTALGILAAAPESALFLLPGLFRSYDEVDYIITMFRKKLDRFYEEKGYILAGIIDTGFFYLFLKNNISNLADVKQQKILTWFGIVETTLYNELGIEATPVAVPEVVSALSTGMANACLGPAAWMLGMQAYQYTNYYIKPALLYSPGAMIVSMKVKERLRKQFGLSNILADNMVELLLSEILSLEPDWQRQIRSFEEKSLKAFEVKCGMKAITLSPDDLERLDKAGSGVQKSLAGKIFPKELLNDITRALGEYRARNDIHRRQ